MSEATPLDHATRLARHRRRRRVRHHVAPAHHAHHHAPSLLHVLGASWDLRITAAFFAVLVVTGGVALRAWPTTPATLDGPAPSVGDAPEGGAAVGPAATVLQGARPRRRGVPLSIALMVVSTFVLPFSVVAVELHTGKATPNSAVAGAFVSTIWLVLSLAFGAVAVARPALRAGQRRRDEVIAVVALGLQLASLLAGLLSVVLALQPLLTSVLHS